MKNNFRNISILAVVFLISSSFVVEQKTPTKMNSDIAICGQIIKYTTDTLIAPSGDKLIALTEVTINPITKVITVESFPKDQEKVLFETQIESIECSFNEKLTSGKAMYSGYTLQKDGSKSPISVALEAKQGVVNLTSYVDEKEIGLMAKFSKWEIIKNKD